MVTKVINGKLCPNSHFDSRSGIRVDLRGHSGTNWNVDAAFLYDFYTQHTPIKVYPGAGYDLKLPTPSVLSTAS